MSVILLDGAAGTLLWDMADAAGVKKVPVWRYNIEHPEFVTEMHRRYIAAGCDMIQTNTFTVNAPELARVSDYTVPQVISAAVRLARSAVQGTGVRVYMSVGPLNSLLAPYGKLGFDEARTIYREIFTAGAREGADAIMLETFTDVRMAELAAREALETGLPVVCSMTFAKRRRTMMGDTVNRIVDTLAPLGISGIGMNCSAGPVEALDIIRDFHALTELPLYFKPNSGMGEKYSAAQFAEELRPALGIVGYIGGCCGCDDSYIREIKKLM